MAEHNKIGKIGEDLAANWLKSKGFAIIERNYRKKLGEIDIVARETDVLHFIEVKSVSYETKDELGYAVSHETWRPEDNVHNEKIRRMKNAIQVWLVEFDFNGAFVVDILSVRMVPCEKFARIVMLKDVILD